MPASRRSDELLALLLMLPLPLPPLLPPVPPTEFVAAFPTDAATEADTPGALLLDICCGTVLFDKSSIIRGDLRSRSFGPGQSMRHS